MLNFILGCIGLGFKFDPFSICILLKHWDVKCILEIGMLHIANYNTSHVFLLLHFLIKNFIIDLLDLMVIVTINKGGWD